MLDVGAGEGQLARRLAATGASVVALDLARAQVEEARRRGTGCVLQATASDLPLRSASFDAVLVCLVLEHTPGLDEATREIARVLRCGGRLVLFLNHPLLQAPGSGWIDDHVLDPPQRYWRVGPYSREQVYEEQVAR